MTFLYVLTVLLFALVLGTRYFTAMHMSKLTQQHVQVENLCQQLQHRYTMARKKREATEGEEKSVQAEGKVIEAKLEDLKQDLLEEEGRVSGLKEQIETFQS